MSNTLNELQARHQMAERVAQASHPRMPRTTATRRHRVAERLRKVADRVDN